MTIPKYITSMDMDEFLAVLDDYGIRWHYIHEAARRIRQLQEEVRSLTSQSSGREKPYVSIFRSCDRR